MNRLVLSLAVLLPTLLVGCSATAHLANSDGRRAGTRGPTTAPADGKIESADGDEEYDYVEIVRPDGMRRDPMFIGVVGFSFGEYDHGTRMSALDDDVAAATLRVRSEFVSPKGFGGGFTAEFTDTDDELFEDNGVSDGEARLFDIFPYAVFRFADAGARMPVRFGPYIHVLEIDDATTTDTRWASYGARIEIEPEVILHRNGRNEISLFAEASGGLHFTQIKLDRAGPDEDFDADGYSLRGIAGVRGRWSGFSASLGYLVRYHNVDRSDVEGGQFISEIDTVVRGLFFEAGIRF
ncbi:MAG: hypothetical protein AAF488_05625 [Planctomycetota bacterium]